jgi:hypothetical protein
MAILYYPSLDDGDVIAVEFLKPDGDTVSKTLLIDSGFTGQSCFVLSRDATDLSHAAAPASRTVGALAGMHNRVLVICRIPALAFQRTLIAIIADISSLSLPPGVEGMVGLRFLRHFARWGAELTTEGGWRFFLSNGEGDV